MKILCCCLSLLLGLGSVSQSFSAQSANHVVSTAELHTTLIQQSEERKQNLAEIRTLLHDESVRNQLRGIANLDKVESSLANLDDETLRELGVRARQVHRDVTAGANKTVVILIVATLIVASVVLNLIPRD